MQEIAVW